MDCSPKYSPQPIIVYCVVARCSKKIRGFLDIFTNFVNRGLGAWRNFAGRGLLLTAKTAHRNDVITSSDISECHPSTTPWTIAVAMLQQAIASTIGSGNDASLNTQELSVQKASEAVYSQELSTAIDLAGCLFVAFVWTIDFAPNILIEIVHHN